jgi:hypothetical protein
MPLRLQVRTALAGLAPTFLAAAILAGCSAAPTPVIAPPPPPPPPPAVALSPKLVEMASAYRYYMVRTTGITPDFADGPAIARSLQTGAAYEPDQMVRGAMAYAAVVALQDKSFVEGVRVYVADPVQRQQVAYEILKDPAYVLGIRGASSAAGLVIAAIGTEGQQLYDEGKAVKQSAYDIQRQPWSKLDVADREARLAGAKSLSANAMRGDVAETLRLQQASVGAAPMSLAPSPASPPYTPTVVRGLAIAALAALGQAGDANMDQVLGLMNEPNIGRCMSMSKLNLYQCLAVARPHYEDVFCLGQHAMMDTGRCMIKATGLPEPYEARFIPDASSIAKGFQEKKPPVKKKTRRKS